jgi:hypothetical protein
MASACSQVRAPVIACRSHAGGGQHCQQPGHLDVSSHGIRLLGVDEQRVDRVPNIAADP